MRVSHKIDGEVFKNILASYLKDNLMSQKDLQNKLNISNFTVNKMKHSGSVDVETIKKFRDAGFDYEKFVL